MGPFKKYVTCIMTFFIPFTYVTLCQFYSITFPLLITKINKLWNKRKKHFLYIWFTVSCYVKVGRKSYLSTQLHFYILSHTCMYRQPTLTKYWNYNVFVQILYITSYTLTDAWMWFSCSSL